jgi:vesicle-associated membrane protein 7
MPIIYSLVSRGPTVLAEYTGVSGNFAQVTRRILDRIPVVKNTKISYVYDRFVKGFFNGVNFDLCR